MWSELRADAARRDLAALARAELAPADAQQAAMDVVARVVPADAACWATVDPETLLLTGSVAVAFDATPEMEQRFVEIEQAGADVHPFAGLVGRPGHAVRLSDAARDAVERSDRVNELWRPLGIRHELRAAFVSNGACWGVAGLFRGAGNDFSDRELAFVASVTEPVADALRRAATRRTEGAATAEGGPAVIVVGPDGEPRAATGAARDRLRSLAAGHGLIALRSVVAAVKSGAASARARLRDADGGWVVLDGAPLDGEAGRAGIAVTVERAGSRQLVDLLLRAHGLSERERTVCLLLLDGLSTKQLAGALYISPHTVQDHLKSVFAKIGVGSRRELVARLNAA